MSDSPSARKRKVNEIMQDTLRGSGGAEPIAFFCECASDRCYQAVWLTVPGYDQAGADHRWAAVVPGHHPELAPGKPAVGKASPGPAAVEQLAVGMSG